jgi:hypothetical protein
VFSAADTALMERTKARLLRVGGLEFGLAAVVVAGHHRRRCGEFACFDGSKCTFVSNISATTKNHAKSFRQRIKNVISDALTKAFGEYFDICSRYC